MQYLHRKFISLSDADVKRLALKAASGGLLPEELLQNFIGDLVRGTYSIQTSKMMEIHTISVRIKCLESLVITNLNISKIKFHR